MENIIAIDLFAGPGGLGEGFSSYQTGKINPFNLALSIEKEHQAHKTLELRSFFRHCRNKKSRDDYYEYLKNPSEEKRDLLFSAHPEISLKAKNEALCLELGRDNKFIHEKILPMNNLSNHRFTANNITICLNPHPTLTFPLSLFYS